MSKEFEKTIVYSALEVANICGVANQTAINWIRNGYLKAYSTPGGQYRVYADDLVTAGLTFAAEKAAVHYLERSEQSRYLLTIKLKKKEYTERAIAKALDYLGERGFLSDVRYAQAWLRNRSINHAEGRNRLLSGLLAKGIDRKIASAALDEYFESVSQEDVLERAIEKCHRLGKSQEATEKYLLRNGFSYKEIKSKISKI